MAEKRFEIEVANCTIDIMVSQTQHRFNRVREVAEPFLSLSPAKLVPRNNSELEAAWMTLGTSHSADDVVSGSSQNLLQGQDLLSSTMLTGDFLGGLVENQPSDDLHPNLSITLKLSHDTGHSGTK